MRFSIITLIFALFLNTAKGQKVPANNKIYSVNLKWELPVAAAFLGSSYFGFRALDKYASLDADYVNNLNTNNINAFDRPVAFNNPAHFESAQNSSDLFLNIAVVSPVILALDKRVRKNWATVIPMFLMAHAVDNAIYFGTILTIRRARPLTYNPDYEIFNRIGEAKSNSFFSGHVSFSATSTFFAAKVYTDYHDIKGLKRMLFFAGAAIPPGIVGYYRMRAGKHFRTDVLTGLIVGAASGILTPQLHKRKTGEKKLSLLPYYNQRNSGLTLQLHI